MVNCHWFVMTCYPFSRASSQTGICVALGDEVLTNRTGEEARAFACGCGNRDPCGCACGLLYPCESSSSIPSSSFSSLRSSPWSGIPGGANKRRIRSPPLSLPNPIAAKRLEWRKRKGARPSSSATICVLPWDFGEDASSGAYLADISLLSRVRRIPRQLKASA
mmetsp:Transcript_16002/g.48585  ORF Transcript_16002/g.48585 Transcript_16002/m.48585 type:complete len:164 (+) Transcript_16002:176-667(+)